LVLVPVSFFVARQTLYLPNVLDIVPVVQFREKNDELANGAIRGTS